MRSATTAPISVLVLDDVDETVDEREELFEVVRPADLDIEPREFHHMATIYNVLELATAVKPWLLRHAAGDERRRRLPRPRHRGLRLARAVGIARPEAFDRAHAALVDSAAARRAHPERADHPAGRRVQPRLHRGVARRAPFLSWWEERLRRECRIAPTTGLFVDQRWVDFVPSYFEHTVVTDEGYNVAYWNLFERELKRGRRRLRGQRPPAALLPLQRVRSAQAVRTEQASGRQDAHPARRQLRSRVSLRPLRRPARRRRARGSGWHGVPVQLHRTVSLSTTGRAACTSMRSTADEARDVKSRLPDPFDPDEADAFITWLNVPDPLEPQRRLSRYLRGVYDDRPDIAAHFPELSEQGEIEFLEWIGRHGRGIAGVPPDFMPPPTRLPRADPGECPEGVNLVGYLRRRRPRFGRALAHRRAGARGDTDELPHVLGDEQPPGGRCRRTASTISPPTTRRSRV